MIVDWGFSWGERLAGASGRTKKHVARVKAAMKKMGIGTTKDVNFNGKDRKDAENAWNDTWGLLKRGSRDPCFKGLVFFGHGSKSGSVWSWSYTGNIMFGDVGIKDDMLGDHKLEVCFMAMCGADQGDWGDSVGDGGIYQGGEGAFHPPLDQGSMVTNLENHAAQRR